MRIVPEISRLAGAKPPFRTALDRVAPPSCHPSLPKRVRLANKKDRPGRRPSKSYFDEQLSQFRRAFGVHADEFASLAFVFKFNETFDQSEQGIVFAASDIIAGFPFGAALAGKDIAAKHALAAKFLQPKPLRVRIAAVS